MLEKVMKDKKLVIAVDFDGTLCKYAFPKIGEAGVLQGRLLEILIDMRKAGHKVILWTNRGDNDEYPVLSKAVAWCKRKGLEFDAINENIPGQKKLSGYSPKIMADFYIDDKALRFNGSATMLRTLKILGELV